MQNMKFSIGRMFNESVTSTSFGDIKESYPLYGQIEMVAASSELCTSATLLQLEDDLNCMSKTNEYDDLGMLKNTYVYDKNDSCVMTLTRNYQTRTSDSTHISQRINMDTFAIGDQSYWVRQYQYDAMGNVTKIYGETPDRHDYTYDYRNFLVNDNGTVYEYDGNGNITKKGTTTFTYDTVIKDRLVKVGNTPVTYSTANPLNPATYGNCSYNFKGRRLQSFTKSGSTYNYIYDEQGLRTRKIAPDGSVTKYLYNGTKLAAEIAPNYRLDFLYDENDMLYGFVKDGSAKYFYARDMLQNILGIIDTNGSPVVIYQYTAYGTSTVLQDTAGLASINPFRFKGYYFDSESGMYYCHTRYYVPEWCRWLNADHPSFLQPESLQEMNLFAYCGNNPVICYDPTGHFWDYVFDVAFLIWSVADVIKNPNDWKNWVALGIDIIFAVIPFVPSGVGQVIKIGNKVDDALDVANMINKLDYINDIEKITIIGRNMNRVDKTAKNIGKAANIYVAWKGYDRGAKGLKKLIHNSISMAHDGGWLLGKLRQGYTVIDIGIKTTHTGRKAFGLWYGTERAVLTLWETRNIWKLFLNYFF